MKNNFYVEFEKGYTLCKNPYNKTRISKRKVESLDEWVEVSNGLATVKLYSDGKIEIKPNHHGELVKKL